MTVFQIEEGRVEKGHRLFFEEGNFHTGPRRIHLIIADKFCTEFEVFPKIKTHGIPAVPFSSELKGAEK